MTKAANLAAAANSTAGNITASKVQNSGVTTNALAWVNFNGTSAGPITPRSNYNVSSVTKSATGAYVLNFTSALSDANYAVVGSAQDYTFSINGSSLSTTSVAVQVYYVSGTSGQFTRLDEAYVCVAIFGN